MVEQKVKKFRERKGVAEKEKVDWRERKRDGWGLSDVGKEVGGRRNK